ncbi:MAG: Tim44 domain-containing protein [Pigmentiphaga sp.]
MSRPLTSRLFAIAIMVLSTVAMLGVSFEAEAQRRLGGGSFGRQSSNVMQQRQAVTPPAASGATAGATQRSAASSTAASGAAASTAARSGMSRWLGPIAGIAAGLGLAALFSSLGMGGALAEFLSSMLLIGLLVFAVLFIVRRLRGGGSRPAMQGAGANHGYGAQPPMQRQAQPMAPAAAPVAQPATNVHPAVASTAAPTAPADPSWYVPADFDTQAFLQNAKKSFIELQGAWDRNDIAQMRDYMTDDLIDAVKEPLAQREPDGHTEVVLLNASMLGIEDIAEGHLASVRFSGMLKDGSGPEAYRFEEVWNFLKPTQGGWLLAGIQQIPISAES